MSGRPGRRLHSGVSSGSQHDIRGKKKESKSAQEDDDRHMRDGGGDSKWKTDEVRISRLTRLLARLDTEESFYTICGQIEGALLESDNQKYVSRCFSCLSPSFLEVFKGLVGLTWEATAAKRYAQLLAKICQAMENHRSRFFQWFVDSILRTSRGSQTHVSSSAYIMESVSIYLITLLEQDDVIIFVKCVYDVLEDVGNPRVFRVLGTIFVSGTNVTDSIWRNPHFQDFIDMVVGWMVDVRQSNGQFASCSELLVNSKFQFEKDLRFLVTLMSQILEDLEQAIKKVQPTSGSESDEFSKVLQLLRAFTTLLALECPLDKLVVNEFCDRLVASALQFIRMSEPHKTMDRKYRYELLSTVNKALFCAGGVLGQSITKIFRAQLKLGSANSTYLRWPKLFLTSFLESITVWAEVAVAQTQLTEDICEICETLLTVMDDMYKNLPSHDQHYVLNLVIALLRTRNVNLLQKTYGWLISKMPASDAINSNSAEDDECILFVLAGLADTISNRSNSILSLWALQPPVFELLVDVTGMKVHSRTRQCALELLKTHCLVHSHFVSSIASTGTFNTDSPGTRFLPALMSFWIEKLTTLNAPEDKWIVDWIFEFLQNTSSYATLLHQVNPAFYEEFFTLITKKGSLLMYAAKIFEWFCKSLDYVELGSLYEIIQKKIITILLDENTPFRMKHQYKRVLYLLPQLVIASDESFWEDCLETEVMIQNEGVEIPALTSTEFNLFLYELLVKNSPNLTYLPNGSTDNNILSVAADHLLRQKLRTPLGKPQDFFAHLFSIFKRHRLAKTFIPKWKIYFVFELEKKFQLWIYGSAIDEAELNELVRTYYLMNKSPFLEWLKRIRTEIIDSCVHSKEYSLVYFNAALMSDSQKMENALFQLNDSLGLKGMGNLVGHYYLEGRYEEALRVISNAEDNSTTVLNDEVSEKSKKMLEDCFESLQKWPEPDEVCKESSARGSLLQNDILVNLLDMQLHNANKTSISIMGDSDTYESLKLPTIQKIHAWLLNSPEDTFMTEKDSLERLRMEKMIENRNIDYVKNWLVKRDVDINNIVSEEDLHNFSLASIPVSILKVCADFYAEKVEYRKSVILYNILRELVTGSIDADLANKVTLSLSARILESDDFFSIFSSESLTNGSRLETVKSLYQVALHSYPEYAKTWVEFGDFSYNYCDNRSGELEASEVESMKYTTIECYCKYMQLCTAGTDISTSGLNLQNPKAIVMTRLLQLFREGYEFSFESVINSVDWLMLLAEIAQIPQLRSFILEKFPDQAALFLTSHDSKIGLSKSTVRRRHLFDLGPYSYVDTSEEPLSSSVILSHLSQLERKSTEVSTDSISLYTFRSELNLPISATFFAKELLRLACSMEDMWIWSLERIAVDWSRRLTYLRKESTRSSSSEKIKIFVQPIVTYLNTLLGNTAASQSPVDVNFMNRHRNDIKRYLDLIGDCETLEEVSSAMNSFLKYSERFGLLMNNKLPVSMFSLTLTDPDIYQQQNFSLCLPGQPAHLKICGVHPIVHALPTKAKPKRVRILASNGKHYDYLVKGTENLNIDCGVMQFLNVAQSFFNQRTRTYSVTPLGKRGGLIQIVPDAVPLFSLYKKHLQRNKSLEKTSEMFWSRMNSLGYDDRSCSTALREVYEELCSETSCDLISRELLLAASTPSQWLNSVQTFTKDCAIGSGVGYLLGIGDRHLDNMLVNVARGKFINVDFTIIFGKGATLRVPEKVPFRLTQNIASVLQYPGPTGVFAVILDMILSSVQKDRNTAMHLIKNIAFTHQYDEDSPVDLTLVLLSEVESAVKLFLCRCRHDLAVFKTIRYEILELQDKSNDSVRKISRKINRWRRMLVNLNTVLQFISSTVLANTSPYEEAISLIQNQWTSLLQTCLEMGMENETREIERLILALENSENVLNELHGLFASTTDSKLTSEMVKLQDSNVQLIDMNKLNVVMSYAEMNVRAYQPLTTANKLIDEATSIDNLAQMYEGWTAWV